jgi:hypothetical protein
MNPYVALLTGPALNKVDLDKINYPEVRVGGPLRAGKKG